MTRLIEAPRAPGGVMAENDSTAEQDALPWIRHRDDPRV